MTPRAAAVGSAIFFLVAPTVVSGVVPGLLTGWVPAPGLPGWWRPVAVVGWLLVLVGVLVLLAGFVRFVREGRGTPAPLAPPAQLVTGGLYAWVRNPMYLAILAIITGQAAILGRWGLLVYGLGAALVMVAMVKLYEEPKLSAAYGEQYAVYRRQVPGWWPRRPVG